MDEVPAAPTVPSSAHAHHQLLRLGVDDMLGLANDVDREVRAALSRAWNVDRVSVGDLLAVVRAKKLGRSG